MSKKKAPPVGTNEAENSGIQQAELFAELPKVATPKSEKTEFIGTTNPRHHRAIGALLVSPVPRETLDSRVGCTNSPELVAELRRRGLAVPCVKVPTIDRDGKTCRRGIYSLTNSDRAAIRRWQARRGAG